MKDYVLFTDSTADLPADIYKELDIEVVPFEFLVEGKPYRHYGDAREMSYEEFYRRIKDGQNISTAQINAYTFEECFTPFLEKGQDLLYICFSSGLSGTYDASVMAVNNLKEKFPDRKITTIDCLCASVGQGLLVYKAGLLYRDGAGFDELEAWVYENRLKIRHWFVVDDLEHLHKGGRVSAATAVMGTALGVKPLLTLDAKGKLVTAGKPRGEKKVIEAFCRKISEEGDNPGEQTVIIGHAANIALARKLEAELKKRGLIKDAIISDVGPVIGAHVGCGMVALIYFSAEDLKD